MSAENGHGGDGWYWDNFGEGWRMACICGFVTCPDRELTMCGEEMDEHLAAPSDSKEAL